MIIKATYTGKFQSTSPGEVRALVTLVGDSGDPWVEGFSTRASTVDAIADDVAKQVRARNETETRVVALTAAMQQLADKEIPLAVKPVQVPTPAVDPAVTWRMDAARLLWLKDLEAAGVTAVAEDAQALVDNLNKTYQAGFAAVQR